MSALEDRMEAIRASLAAMYPARVVTRKWQPITMLPAATLAAGQYTFASRGESGYANTNGREAMDGQQAMLLICRFVLPESSDGLAVEQLEFAMVEEVKAWLRTLSPGPLCCLVATGFTQSGQLEAPYGWVIFELEFLCD